jgi:retinol dehydrogenase 12
VGFALAQFLYPKNATVYLAGRSQHKGDTAIEKLHKQFPNSKGRVEFLQLDLSDLPTIKASAETFLKKEKRLDVLVNNAGVMVPPPNSKTPQGYDLQTGTNVYGPWLFTQFLIPLLKETAKHAETGTVRVSWAASLAVDVVAPKGGVQFKENGLVADLKDVNKQYGQTKVANVLLGIETARRLGGDGIISNASFGKPLADSMPAC